MRPARLMVLASTAGTRQRIGKTRPKSLAEVAGLSLIERAVAGAHHAGFAEVVVVTSDRADEIDRHVLEVSRRRGITVTVVHNLRPPDGHEPPVSAVRDDGISDEPVVVVRAEGLFSPALLRRLGQVPVEPSEVVVAVDTRLDRAAWVERQALKVRIADGYVQEIGEHLPAYDAFDIGAFVCGPTVFATVETAAASSDGGLAAVIQGLVEAGAVRALPIGYEEWWPDGDTARGHRHGRRHLFRAAGKPSDGTIASRLNRTLSVRAITPTLLALRAHITPNQVTLVAFATAVVAAACIAVGAPLLGGLLVALSSVLDRSDGEVARLTYRSSVYGGFLDAVLDRAADGILFIGAATFLATNADLHAEFGGAQVPVALLVSGAALVGHQLVSYTTARAVVELGHSYRGTWLGGGKGRDRRLLMVTVGALAAAAHPIALLVSLMAVALLSSWIVVVRLRQSWWVAGPGSEYVGVRAVALDLDGTIADSMGFLTELGVGLLVDELGFQRADAVRRYVATAGSEFATQLEEVAPGHARLAEVASRFETEKAKWMPHCVPFPDVIPAVDRLVAAGFPVLLCSSTRESLVRDFCERHGLLEKFASVDGWMPGHEKRVQLALAAAATGFARHEVVFVGDTRRDADIARACGTRFVGLVRVGHPDALAGSGAKVVSTPPARPTDLVRAGRSSVTTCPPN